MAERSGTCQGQSLAWPRSHGSVSSQPPCRRGSRRTFAEHRRARAVMGVGPRRGPGRARGRPVPGEPSCAGRGLPRRPRRGAREPPRRAPVPPRPQGEGPDRAAGRDVNPRRARAAPSGPRVPGSGVGDAHRLKDDLRLGPRRDGKTVRPSREMASVSIDSACGRRSPHARHVLRAAARRTRRATARRAWRATARRVWRATARRTRRAARRPP